MSKSVGNVVDPRIVINGGKDAKKDPPYGADVLRLWVASVDYSTDVMVSSLRVFLTRQTRWLYFLHQSNLNNVNMDALCVSNKADLTVWVVLQLMFCVTDAVMRGLAAL